MPTLFSYIVDHDKGYAPNPSNDICTLAYCKYPMRPHVQEGDYVVGLGKKKSGQPPSFVYAMRVTEVMEHKVYLEDSRFAERRADYDNANAKEEIAKSSRVLISDDFAYWGRDRPPLPSELSGLIVGRGYKSNANDHLIPEFLEWFEGIEKGRLGDPTDMDESKRGECC